MAKFPEDFEPVTGYVEDPKVYTCFCQKVEKTKAVPHAYYRALEEELAALRGKVGELVEADLAFDACIANQVIDDKVYDRRQAAMGTFA